MSMTDIVRIGQTTDILGESPAWCQRRQALYWVDIRQPAVRRLDHASSRIDSWPMPDLVGSLAVIDDDRLLVALSTMLAVLDTRDGALTEIARPPEMLPDQRFNDGKCDPSGRFWVGTMNNVTRAPEGVLYRLDPGGRLTPQAGGIQIPNSLAWSPDRRTMYFSDSLERTIYAFAFDDRMGSMGARRVLARTTPPAIPDGAATDAEGYLWCAEYDGWRIARHAPDGRIDRIIELPVQRPTSCAFGGPDMETLYITTATQRLTPEELAGQPLAGALLALRPGVRGSPVPRCRC
jgi:sugar lactone lactonase YvrE